MSKWILIIAVAVGGLLVWKFGLNGSGSGDNPFTKHIPADTVLYSGGKFDKKILEASSDFYAFPMMPSQEKKFADLLTGFDLGETPAATFFESLVSQYRTENVSSFIDGIEASGVALDGYYALYVHGAVPVFRVTMADPTKFVAKIDKAAADSGIQYTKETIGSATAYLWALNPDSGINMQVVYALEGNLATITVFFEQDDNAVRMERLGQTALAKSLASEGVLDAIQKQYGYQDFSLAYIHIENLVNGLVNSNANSLGKDLARYLPEKQKNKLFNTQSDACKKEFAQLAGSVPRLVSGYTKLDYGSNTATMRAGVVLELADETVKSSLSQIRGHVPSHVLDAKQSIMSFGLGLNVNGLAPALTSLWSQFTQAEYSCDTLVAMQAKAQQNNPAMIQMFVGMVQGVKGFGVSLYDFVLDAAMQPQELSLLASIAAESPEAIAAMTSMIPLPQLSGLTIPTDGTPVKLDLPMIPPTIAVNAAIKGKHLVVYSGAKAEAVAKGLAKETLENNGVYGLGINYRNLSKVFDVAGKTGKYSCTEAAEMRHVLSMMKMDLSVLMDFTDRGVAFDMAASVDKPSVVSLTTGGKYTIELLNDVCAWDSAGVEEWRADGTGAIVETFEADGCSTYEADINWKQQGNNVVVTTTKGRFRDSCDAEWSDNTELTTQTCSLINISGKSFECLYDAGTDDAMVYRYTSAN